MAEEPAFSLIDFQLDARQDLLHQLVKIDRFDVQTEVVALDSGDCMCAPYRVLHTISIHIDHRRRHSPLVARGRALSRKGCVDDGWLGFKRRWWRLRGSGALSGARERLPPRGVPRVLIAFGRVADAESSAFLLSGGLIEKRSHGVQEGTREVWLLP